ncbi:MAG TPA: DoxX family protein [Nevskia sp.]|nr:DoxX family protein [Nevskia sp.]
MSPALVQGAQWLARAGLCLAFVYSGISKLFDFSGAVAEQAHFGMNPPALFAAATIAVQLGSSAMMLFLRGWPAALGALALAGFTLLATFVGHPFWRETGMERFADLNSFLEHFGLVGGFVLVALLELTSTRADAGAPLRAAPR